MRAKVLTLRFFPNLGRFDDAERQRRRQLAAGVVNEQHYADSVRAVIAHLRHGNTLRLRRMLFAGDAARAAAGPFLRQPREPRRQLQQRAVERAVPAPRQDVTPPDRVDRLPASARSAP